MYFLVNASVRIHLRSFLVVYDRGENLMRILTCNNFARAHKRCVLLMVHVDLFQKAIVEGIKPL